MKTNNDLGLQSLSEIFGSEDTEKGGVRNIQLRLLHTPLIHPFRVLDDSDMDELVTSVKTHGVLTPGIARPRPQGGYELLSGNRRQRAAALAGLNEMPAFVRDYSDDEAIVIMVDSNIQRTNLLPSEKAFAYRMKYDALKRQGQRNDLIGNENVKSAIEEMEITSPDTRSQILRYIRLTYLLPAFINLVDNKKIPFNTAVELSYISTEEQQLIYDYMCSHSLKPTLKQAKELHSLSKTNSINTNGLRELFEASPNGLPSVKLSSNILKKYFPVNYTEEEMLDVILTLLNTWCTAD